MPKGLIIDNHTRHLEELRALIPFETVVMTQEKITPEVETDFDIVFLTGGSGVPPVAEYPEAYTKEFALVRSCVKPMIGICLGCEILAAADGATFRHLEERQKGPISLSVEPAYRDTLGVHSFVAYEAHTRALASLPASFDLVAHSDHGPEIIRHKSRPIWGLQFHPEHFADRTLGDEVFHTILNLTLT